MVMNILNLYGYFYNKLATYAKRAVMKFVFNTLITKIGKMALFEAKNAKRFIK
jgi:hypothetical protein